MTLLTVFIVCQAVTWCRGAMVMMQYSVMANNYWLLVEGIYLHSLLVITVFSERKYFYIYLSIGWGKDQSCYTVTDGLLQKLYLSSFPTDISQLSEKSKQDCDPNAVFR